MTGLRRSAAEWAWKCTRYGSEDHPGRLVTLMLEFYQGPSPYGQFFQDDISYVGVGLHFGL